MGKPTYLGLLNSIAVNEKKGEQFLNAWADATDDEQLEAALRFVAIREGEHAWAFTKRMCELGYGVSEKDAFNVFQDFDALMSCVTSDACDADKVAFVTAGIGERGEEGERTDPFASFFNDTTIDPETGALLGRYVCEERDSGRRLQAEYDRIAKGRSESASELDELRACIEAL
ncbi:MAG: hypothetical protein P8Y69_17470, partial [Gammaproteobacteria bacterium]